MERRRYLDRVPVADARERLLGTIPGPLPSELVPTEQALGRITAEAVNAVRSVPHYKAAAMDGIAVRAADTFGARDSAPLELVLEPGAAGKREVSAQTAVPVDTGQTLPDWADAVVMIEQVENAGPGRVRIRAAATPWQHVRPVGEDIVATEPLLPRGHRIRPHDIGALLASGVTSVPVVRRPVVAIVPTGDELVEPSVEPPPGAIVEFNSRVAAALVAEWGGVPRRMPCVPDDPARLRSAVRTAADSSDLVVVIAGSSAGTRDHTPGVLAEMGTLLFHGVQLMPGKPAAGAVVSGTPVLGLPGYPVSAVIICRELLAPALARMLGTEPPELPRIRAVVPRKIPSRLGLEEIVRVTVGQVGRRWIASPLARGAGAISTLVRADGWVRIPVSSEGIDEGTRVTVELLRPPEELRQAIVFSGSHDPALGLLEDCLRRRIPAARIAASNTGSIAGLLALGRGEAHVAGVHLLDPDTGTYNIPEIRRLLGEGADVVLVAMALREQGLVVAPGNPKRIRSLRDLVRRDVRFINRQAGSGTRVLLDHLLAGEGVRREEVRGYEREEYTHMAVAAAVASGAADCGLAVRRAATALGLSFIPLAQEEYDLVLRGDFARSRPGRIFLDVLRSGEFRRALDHFGGYDSSPSGTIKRWKPPAPRGRNGSN